MIGTPLEVRNLPAASSAVGSPSRSRSTLELLTSACAPETALAGSDLVSWTMMFTGCPLSPPVALTHLPQACTVVAVYFTDEPPVPLSDASRPILIGVPVAAGAELGCPDGVVEPPP